MCQLCYNPDQSSDFSTNASNPIPQSMGASQTTINQVISAMNGSSWSSQGSPASVTYSFDGPWGQVATGNYGGQVNQLSAADQAMVVDMFDMYAAVANVTFTETTNGSDADIAVRNEYIQSSVGGYAYLPGSGVGGNVTLDSQLGPIQFGSFSGYAAIHELGHAMGMYHPFSNSPSAAKAGDIPANELNADWTVMSYSDGAMLGRKDVTGLQKYDILLMQYKYGANLSHNADDTVYEFGVDKMGESIWDGDGIDTFKVADGVQGDAIIDLRDDGGWTQIGNATVNVAYNAEIENAIGGNGNDTIYSNELDNVLTGGAGKDTFKITIDDGDVDVITDLDVAGGEKVQLEGLNGTVTEVDIVDGTDGAIARLTTSDGAQHTISLEGVSAADITVGSGATFDFAFSGTVTSNGSTTLPAGGGSGSGGGTGTGGTGGTGTGGTGGTNTGTTNPNSGFYDAVAQILAKVAAQLVQNGTPDQLLKFLDILVKLNDAGFFDRLSNVEFEEADFGDDASNIDLFDDDGDDDGDLDIGKIDFDDIEFSDSSDYGVLDNASLVRLGVMDTQADTATVDVQDDVIDFDVDATVIADADDLLGCNADDLV